MGGRSLAWTPTDPLAAREWNLTAVNAFNYADTLIDIGAEGFDDRHNVEQPGPTQSDVTAQSQYCNLFPLLYHLERKHEIQAGYGTRNALAGLRVDEPAGNRREPLEWDLELRDGAGADSNLVLRLDRDDTVLVVARSRPAAQRLLRRLTSLPDPNA